ncbi:undecaprenyl-phosphate glucose phosphotransferase [Raoultella sp. FYR_9]|uniref:undecaprenyl-phosphate glucose phosphotransferase n=1 Tax=Raoultella sp. FYR_9 TaxID=3367176 RepID=UPI0035D2599F
MKVSYDTDRRNILTFHRAHPKTNASLISMIQRIADISIVFLGLGFVVYIHKQDFNYTHLIVGLISLSFFQMIGGITDFYRSWRGVKLTTELKHIINNWTLSLLFTSGLIYFFVTVHIGGLVIIEWYLVSCMGMILARCTIRYGTGMLRQLGFNTRNVAIAGSLPTGLSLLKGFQEEAWLGFNVIGVYDESCPEDLSGLPYIGNFDKLIDDARSGKLDRIYLATKMSDYGKLMKLLAELTDTTCSVSLIPDIFTFNILQSRTEEIHGIPVVPLFETPLNGINMIFKRLEDIIFSIAILTLISPVLLVIALAVKISSPGPIIFKQTRYGMDGKAIKVWKFRSMKVMENDEVVVQATKNDIRVTSVGSFLRRTSLDELPQFVNVLTGSMSIVGPRPHAVAHNEQYRKLIQGYMLRHKVKPGITGLAQIKGWRGETDTLDKMEKRIECDLEYIRTWSLFLDVKIIFLTIFKGFISKTAY